VGLDNQLEVVVGALGGYTKHKLTPNQIVVDTIMADSASERSSTAVATISSDASTNTRRSATVIPNTEPQRESTAAAAARAVRVTRTAQTIKAEDVNMADATPDAVPISTPKLVPPVPPVVKSALTPVPVPIPAPPAVVTPQAMTSATTMTVAPPAPAPAPLPQLSIPNVDLDLDVDQAIIYELRDKTMTEVFTLKQDNARATGAYTWTMRSHAFE
jgi:hypothetical protein